MGIFNASGSALSAAFSAAGFSVKRAYALDGTPLWKARSLADVLDSAGAHTPWNEWKFCQISNTADSSYTSTAEAAKNFDDSTWESVAIPHDWSIRNDFNSASPATYEGGFLDGGDAWYHTSFTVPEALKTERVVLYFDGVYMEATVYLNGELLGRNYHGYDPFWFDVTDKLADGANVLAVFVRNQQPSSRWYSGSGIFRPVYLLALESRSKWVTEPYVTTPELESQHAGDVTTHVSFVAHNADEAATATAKVTLYKDGKAVTSAQQPVELAQGETAVELDLTVNAPALWDIGKPNLYEAEITLTGDFGSYTVPRVVYGYRWTTWSVDNGFSINGRSIKLKGVCMHHDLGCIGAEANYSAMERQIDSLIQMGANAIRLTHNPSSFMFLDLCMHNLPMEGYTYFFPYEETLPHRHRDYWQMPCAMGADLSRGDDFCAFTFLFPLSNGYFGVKTRDYITSYTLSQLPISRRQQYEEFMQEGTLFVFEGTILDMMQVYDDLDAFIQHNEYDIRAFGYDPYNAKDFVERWATENGSFGITKVIQGARTESVPLGDLKKLSEQRKLIFDEKLMQFAMGNCVALVDTNGNRKLYKQRQDQKIDAVAAMMDAYVAWKENRDAFE